MMNSVVHFEMPYRERAGRFYKAAFGWQTQIPMEIPGNGQYLAFTDTEGNGNGMVQPLMR